MNVSKNRFLPYLLLALVVLQLPEGNHAFYVPATESRHQTGSLLRETPNKNFRDRNNNKPPKKITIADLRKELLKDPQQLKGKPKAKQGSRRTRQRVDQPQQTYVYAAQRKKLQSPDVNDEDTTVATEIKDDFHPLVQAKELGFLNGATQHCDPPVDEVEPEIMGKLRVGESGSEEFAYIINKPAGWSIIGTSNKSSGTEAKKEKTTTSTSQEKPSRKQRVKIKSGGKDEYLEFNEADALALLTPDERAEWEAQGELDFRGPAYDDEDDLPTMDIPGWYDVVQMTAEEREEAGIEDEDFDPDDIPDFDEGDVLALMSPEEIEEYQQEKLASQLQPSVASQANVKATKNSKKHPLQRYLDLPREEMDPVMLENLKRIERRLQQQNSTGASLSAYPRPSVVGWLKDLKAGEGTPIRGGKFWTTVAGATEVDDSGLVILCPKSQTENLFIDGTQYVTVVGNGEYLLPPSKRKDTKDEALKDVVEMEIIAKVRKGRDGDTCQAVRVSIAETPSTCSSIIPHIHAQFADGVRGDPQASPFDRRSSRRLIHCRSLAASSLSHDEDCQAELDDLPDDIAIFAERLNNHKFLQGSFLGRKSLRENPLTNAYRELNGAADGFPGWTVDRYADWLFVQHDQKEYRGPLPSIHDGNTAGVYYLASDPNRGSMGTDSSARPILLEGKAAPETLEILENGVRYHVSLNRDLSTGIFLDQRPQRAWLARNCNEKTHVLNCFAHCGAFSIAAATAGASTVSLDLNEKWLNRVEPQLKANGIEFDERHDCIYGDCFDWLDKLAKRGEKYDIVILDPPSSSVGKKKRRWSVKNDMDELVALAAPLVKEGGLLWTTTNSGSISPVKFARACKRGLDSVGLENTKLEKIQPMPVDFPSIGQQQVKNLVWRIP
jgi:23S rRNA (cytosine1962-C5)-methyltransferase